jgi:hypothetical protein
MIQKNREIYGPYAIAVLNEVRNERMKEPIVKTMDIERIDKKTTVIMLIDLLESWGNFIYGVIEEETSVLKRKKGFEKKIMIINRPDLNSFVNQIINETDSTSILDLNFGGSILIDIEQIDNDEIELSISSSEKKSNDFIKIREYCEFGLYYENPR